MTERLMIENAQVAPMVSLVFDENWITYTLRFVVDFKKRRTTKDQIFSRVLNAARASNGKIVIAASTLEVTTCVHNRLQVRNLVKNQFRCLLPTPSTLPMRFSTKCVKRLMPFSTLMSRSRPR